MTKKPQNFLVAARPLIPPMEHLQLAAPIRSASLVKTREAGTLYDRDGKVQSITVQLEDSRAAAYEPVLTWYYGAPTKVQSVPSEAGATYTEWTHENARIRALPNVWTVGP